MRRLRSWLATAWRSGDVRFWIVLVALHLVGAAILIPWFASYGGNPWSAYLAFGLVWWSFVSVAAIRIVWRIMKASEPPVLMAAVMVLFSAIGFAAGSFLAFAETAIVSGFPPIVLFTTPIFIAMGTGVGFGVGGVLGFLYDRLISLARAAARP